MGDHQWGGKHREPSKWGWMDALGTLMIMIILAIIILLALGVV